MDPEARLRASARGGGLKFAADCQKRVETLPVPDVAAAAATAMTMPAAITPYSMAVTPLRSTFTRSRRANTYANIIGPYRRKLPVSPPE